MTTIKTETWGEPKLAEPDRNSHVRQYDARVHLSRPRSGERKSLALITIRIAARHMPWQKGEKITFAWNSDMTAMRVFAHREGYTLQANKATNKRLGVASYCVDLPVNDEAELATLERWLTEGDHDRKYRYTVSLDEDDEALILRF